jgi:prepilin-type N-terminal cleavage/methylation domain-containing protein
MRRAAFRSSKGFTLIELAIVLVIIGFLLLLVLKPASLIEGAQTKDLIQIANDYKTALHEFKERYHYYPGDLPDAGNSIANISAGCQIAAGTDPVRGDGLIDTNAGATPPTIEVDCVNEHLNRAGLIGIPPGPLVRQYKDRQITIRVIALADSNLSGVLTANIKHIVEYANVPFSMAIAIDSALDDGNLITGNVQRSDTATPNADPVPFLGVKLD